MTIADPQPTQSHPRRCRLWLLLLLAGGLSVPQQAWANAGTPLMWASMLHLVFGNALIGAGEGILVAWLFSIKVARAIPVMILANYVSAWLGGLFLRGLIVSSLPLDLNNGWSWFWIMVGVTYLITFFIEWPFVAWALRRADRPLKRSFRASILVQSVSYLVLFGWYWAASGTSLYTRMRIVSPSVMTLPGNVRVYYIGPADGHVYSRMLSGPGQELVQILHSTNPNDRLLTRPSPADERLWDLVARMETEDHLNPDLLTIRSNLAVIALGDWRSTRTDPPEYAGSLWNFGEGQKLGSATNSAWDFWAGYWAREGLVAIHGSNGVPLGLSHETPFGDWAVRNLVHLPSDKALFQFGKDQICVFDPVSRQVALLWRGRGPVAVIDSSASGQSLPNPAND